MRGSTSASSTSAGWKRSRSAIMCCRAASRRRWGVSMAGGETGEQEQRGKYVGTAPVPVFGPGDTVRVKVKVLEGTRERVQAFEGVVIARKNAGINSNFTVRKISYGEGVERVFPLYSPRIASVELVRRGDVRRAKLYYLRGRRGKSARIAEKIGLSGAEQEVAATDKE